MNNTTIAQKAEPSALFRWMILLFVSLAMFGNYYVYDSISPLADLLAKQLNFSKSNIGLLNAIYSTPNIFMVLIGGIIVDKLGTRISSLIFAFLCLVGAALTASSGDIATMAAGRLVFGLGAESLIVTVTTIIGRWFKGKELSLAFGLNLTIARLGTFAALNSPTWGKHFYESWQAPLIIAVAAAVISIVSVIIYWGMDTYAEKNMRIMETPKSDAINLKEIFTFTSSYWYIVLLCVTFYSAIFPFQTFAIITFVDVRGVSREMGGFLSSILTLSAMILTPLFGLLSDTIGKRSLLMMIGSALLIPVYLMITYTNISLYVPMIMMGISFSLVPAVMWPSVALITKPEKLGTAYGAMTMIQNIGLWAFNEIMGRVFDYTGASAQNPGGYNLGMWIFSSLGFFGLLFAYLLKKSEQGVGGHGLEKPTIGKA